MDFLRFERQVGGASSDPLVGSDPVPSGATSKENSCAFSLRAEGKSGTTTIERLAVTYVGPAAILPVTAYIFDEGTEAWIQTGNADLSPNSLTKLDLIAPVISADSIDIDVYVLVGDPGGLGSGVYTFLVAPDSSAAPSTVIPAGPATNVTVTNFPGNQPVTVTNPIGILNATNVRINPATEETVSSFTSILGTIASNQTDGDQVVQVAASALPAGASTAARQDTGNTSLASIDGKVPSLGQALAVASVPSVLPASQETSLRDISDRAGRLLGHVTVDGSVLPSGAATEAKQDVGNAELVSIDSQLASIDSKTPALGQAFAAGSVPSVLPAAQETSLRDVSDRAGRLLGHVTVDASVLPSGASTSALQGAGLPGALTAGGGVKTGLVDALPAGTNVIGHVIVDSAGNLTVTSSALPTGASTSALQTTGNTSLSNIDNKTPVLGQALAAASTPAVLPAAQETSLRDMSDRAARLVGHVTVDAGTALMGSVIQRPASGSADVTTAHNSGAGALVQKEDGVKSGAGNLFSFLAYNSSTSPRWIYVYDNTTATGTFVHIMQVPPKDSATSTFGFGSTDFPYGRRFSTGLSWAASTTPPGTAFNAAGAEIYAEMEYV